MSSSGEDRNNMLSGASGSEGEKLLLKKLREEVRKKGAPLAKFMELVESFAEDIPDEAKRYGAALKALGHAAGFQKDDVLRAADEQIEELHNQRKVMAASVAEQKSAIKLKQKKAQEIRSQINLLSDSIKRLEQEEKDILISVATGETEIKTIEDRLDSVIQHLRKEIESIKGKIDTNLAKPAPPEAEPEKEAPPKPKPQRPVEKAARTEEEEEEEVLTELAEEEEERPRRRRAREEEYENGITSPLGAVTSPIKEEAPEQGKKKKPKQKPCPVCSNPMDWYSFTKNWKCFVCGHEE